MKQTQPNSFIWNGIVCESHANVGYVLAREASIEDEAVMPTLTDSQVVSLFINEDGRCYAGDSEFNYIVTLADRRLAR
ncbi:hypothetical protein [Meiothermus phage MMP17]|nr:amidophosphoribosyltransferase [Meiothermus phage MMP7]QAY18035.1 hypothetical protein [Meiothermus phage MMP17]